MSFLAPPAWLEWSGVEGLGLATFTGTAAVAFNIPNSAEIQDDLKWKEKVSING
jgi:hypothetical protein